MIEHDNVLCRPQTNSSSLSLQQAMQRWSGRPATTEPIAADAAVESDPIYAAIEACRRAERSFEWNCDKANRLEQDDFDAHTDSLADALRDSFERFAETVPTTTAGLLAQILFEREMRASFASSMFYEVEIIPTLAIAAARLAAKPAA
jgi:hypothetical protein